MEKNEYKYFKNKVIKITKHIKLEKWKWKVIKTKNIYFIYL